MTARSGYGKGKEPSRTTALTATVCEKSGPAATHDHVAWQ